MRKMFLSVLALAFAATATGCGDDKGGGTAGAPASGPVGRWEADMSPIIAMMKPMLEMGVKMAESMGGASADAAESKKKMDEAKQKMADLEKISMVITLKSDGSATLEAKQTSDGKDESGTGKWTQTGDQVTVTIVTVNGKPAEGRKAEAKTFTLKGDTMSATEGPMTLTFKRK